MRFCTNVIDITGNNLSVTEFCIGLYMTHLTTNKLNTDILHPAELSCVGILNTYADTSSATSSHLMYHGTTHLHVVLNCPSDYR